MEKFNYELTTDQVNIVIKSLSKQAYEVVYDTLHAIQIQHKNQVELKNQTPNPDLT